MALKVALKVAPKIPKLILKVILKNKLLPSSTIQYLPKKIREFTHHEQTPHGV